jgi:histidyl-tRNA synthetase
MDYHIAKGVFDILPQDPDPQGAWRESHLWQYVENKIRLQAEIFGFREIRTPLFEHTDLFTRGVGQGTDIVSKEMYTFEDRAGRSLSLRPEGTAPVMRSFIEKRLDQMAKVHKLFYIYPMFRYERQQAGRYRQHHQFGVEAVGNESAFQDVEVIDLLFSFLKSLGIKGLTLHLNSIGNKESRLRYREELKKFLLPHQKRLSKESQERFESNPLRILDSKNEEDKLLLKGAPSILDFLDEASSHHFQAVQRELQAIHVPFKINPSLVRGLDYYNKTVFEITAEEIGAQNSIGGGGRYDGLIKELGGPDLPAFGFGAGIERILQTMLAQQVALPPKPKVTLFFIPMGDVALSKCFELMHHLRQAAISTEMDLGGRKLKSAMQYADLIGAKYVAVVGDNELTANKCELKEMASGKTTTLSFKELMSSSLLQS